MADAIDAVGALNPEDCGELARERFDVRRTISATMRQAHVSGEKLFVDVAGDTVPVFDAPSGEVRAAHVFVAVLGASNYTFAEARWSEGLADWIGAHVDAFGFFGSVPDLVVEQGAEGEVLMGAIDTIGRCQPWIVNPAQPPFRSNVNLYTILRLQRESRRDLSNLS